LRLCGEMHEQVGWMAAKPFAVLGDFWQPVLDRVREVEVGQARRPGARLNGRLVYAAVDAG